MGFELMLNFDLPYFSLNPRDHWRRWHISLNTWFRDYLFIPLGGTRVSQTRSQFNLMVTMVLSGLWHGAAMPFVLWGAFHGALLVLHRMAGPALERIDPSGSVGRAAWASVRLFVMFHLTCLGYLIFRSPTVAEAIEHLMVLGGPVEWGLASSWLFPLAVLLTPLLLIQIAQARSNDLEVMLRWPFPVRTALYLVLGLMIVLLGEDGGQPFIYFQF
jgi:alginate O-acetyltransferase complex protein AlgI